MGHLNSKSNKNIIKEDLNPEYQTYGKEGDVDYALDLNNDYQPSDYDEMYETSGYNGKPSIKARQTKTAIFTLWYRSKTKSPGNAGFMWLSMQLSF